MVHYCPICGTGEGFASFTSFECVNDDCKNFSKRQKDEVNALKKTPKNPVLGIDLAKEKDYSVESLTIYGEDGNVIEHIPKEDLSQIRIGDVYAGLGKVDIRDMVSYGISFDCDTELALCQKHYLKSDSAHQAQILSDAAKERIDVKINVLRNWFYNAEL